MKGTRPGRSVEPLDQLAGCAALFRDRLLPMATIPPTRHDHQTWETRAAARQAGESFWSCVARLRRIRHRRARKLAILWEHAAAMAYWHRLEVFRGAEEQGFALITRLPTRSWSRRHWREFTDALAHASARLDRQMRTTGEHDATD